MNKEVKNMMKEYRIRARKSGRILNYPFKTAEAAKGFLSKAYNKEQAARYWEVVCRETTTVRYILKDWYPV